MTSATATAGERSRRISIDVALIVAAVVAWVVTIAWASARDMGAMPGTMDLSIAAFVGMWAVMMAGMMLPSVSPFVTIYARTITSNRAVRLTALALGYLGAWAATGLVAYVLARIFDSLASDHANVARGLAAATFAAAGLYQLTPLKQRCLSHCRSPIAHLFHYMSFRGTTRDLRSGFLHGLFCLGCCWALMVLLVAFGVMNIAAMVGLAIVIGVEKTWRNGARFARAVGVAALIYAVVVAVSPSLAPGLDPGHLAPMHMMMSMR